MSFQWYGKALINHLKCGSTDSVDFPVYIELSHNDLKTVANGGKVNNSNGYDIAPFSDIGLANILPFEIDHYDGSAGTWAAFIKVSTLSKTTDIPIYIGYSDPTISTSQENINTVWSNGFVAVFHLKNGTILDLTNSVAGGPALTNMNAATATTGLVGLGAAAFNGTNQSLDSHALGTVLSGYPFTLEALFISTSLANGRCMLSVASDASGGTAYTLAERSTGALRATAAGSFATTTAVMTTGTKHYGAATFESTTKRSIFLDGGNKVSDTSSMTVVGTINDLSVGCQLAGLGTRAFFWPGTIDEARVSSVTRSDDWILATWNNLNDPAGFYTSITYGNAVTAGNSGYVSSSSSFSGQAYWNGTSRMLSIDVQILSGGKTVSSMTYGGVACTLIGIQNMASSGRLESWRIHSSDSGAPAAGTNTLVVNLSAPSDFIVNWVNRQHVHPTTPLEAFASASATNSGSATDASLDVTTITDNSIVHFAIVSTDTSIIANQTSRNNVTGASGSGGNEDLGAVTTPPGSVTGSYSGMGTTASWAMTGYSIRPDTAGAQFKSTFNYMGRPLGL